MTNEPEMAGGLPESALAAAQPTGADEADTPQLGAAEALARARAAAQRKGLRPGRLGSRRRRESGSSAGQRRSTSGPDARDPMLVAEALGRLLTNRGWDSDLAVGSIMGRWSVIVGIDVARHCEPERFDRGVLTIRAESTAWAAQLRSFAPTMLGLVEREVGPGLVLELRVLGPGGPSWRRGPLRVRGPGPRDTYG